MRAFTVACVCLATAGSAASLRKTPKAVASDVSVVKEEWDDQCKCAGHSFWYEHSGACIKKGSEGYQCGYFAQIGEAVKVSREACDLGLGCVGLGELAKCGKCEKNSDCLCNKCDGGKCSQECEHVKTHCVSVTVEGVASDASAKAGTAATVEVTSKAAATASATAKHCAPKGTKVTVTRTGEATVTKEVTATAKKTAAVEGKSGGVQVTAEATATAKGTAEATASAEKKMTVTVETDEEICATGEAKDVSAQATATASGSSPIPKAGEAVEVQARECEPCPTSLVTGRKALKAKAVSDASEKVNKMTGSAEGAMAGAKAKARVQAEEKAGAEAKSKAAKDAEGMAKAAALKDAKTKVDSKVQEAGKKKAEAVADAAAKKAASADATQAAKAAAKEEAGDAAKYKAVTKAGATADKVAKKAAAETGKAHNGAGGVKVDNGATQVAKTPVEPTPSPVKTF